MWPYDHTTDEQGNEAPAVPRPILSTGVRVQVLKMIEVDGHEICRFREDGTGGQFAIRGFTRRQFIALLHSFLCQAGEWGIIEGSIPVDDVLHHLDRVLTDRAASDTFTPF
jgi:hypothetical protein